MQECFYVIDDVGICSYRVILCDIDMLVEIRVRLYLAFYYHSEVSQKFVKIYGFVQVLGRVSVRFRYFKT